MRIPFDAIAGALKVLPSAKKDVDVPVRVGVFVDAGAPASLIELVRTAFVPQATSGLVRVERIGEAPIHVKADTDLAIVIAGGSERLRGAVQEVVVGGAPTVVLAEEAAQAPFITEDTPVLGLVAGTDAERLRDDLARWIMARVDKQQAFAANFPILRTAAAAGVIRQAALGNALTGALVIIPGADFPVMTLAQLGMMAQLALIYGKPVHPERGYEAAGVVLAGLAVRALARRVAQQAGPAAFAVKAVAGGAGTYAMGLALTELYRRDVDYAPVNGAVASAVRTARDAFAGITGGAHAPAGERA
ncbi:MAG: hypothetical protein E7001_05950 [Coriobacteriaceae bacterium]|nr:hypothetical protein [Coriobacteriaceae bacterium]